MMNFTENSEILLKQTAHFFLCGKMGGYICWRDTLIGDYYLGQGIQEWTK